MAIATFIGKATNGHQFLWRTDGTAAGTFPIYNFDGGSSVVRTYVGFANFQLGDRQIILLKYGIGSGINLGNLLTSAIISTDGSSANTVGFQLPFGGLVDQFGDGIRERFIDPTAAIIINGKLLAQGYNGGNLSAGYTNHLIVTDGTSDGTVLLAPPSLPAPLKFEFSTTLVSLGNRAIFGATATVPGTLSGVQELYVTDGTSAGTHVLVPPTAPTDAGLNPSGITSLGSTALFFGNDVNGKKRIWTTDGTSEHTVQISPPGLSADASLVALTGFGQRALFGAITGVNTGQLWLSDGTGDGTTLLGNVPVNANSKIYAFAGKAFVLAGSSFWITDGTAAGTTVFNGPATLTNIDPTRMAAFGDRMVFGGSNNLGREGLWISDGTAAGTQELTPAGAFLNGLLPSAFGIGTGQFYFSGRDSAGNFKLWVSDGTSAGTQQIAASDSAAAFAPGSFGVIPDASEFAIATLSADKPEGTGGSTPFTFTVTRTGDISAASTVDYQTSAAGIRPASAPDFDGGVFPAGTVSFAPGQATQTITVPVAGDTQVETFETFTIALANPSSGAIQIASATGVIQPDDSIADIVGQNTTTGLPMNLSPVFYSGPTAGIEKEFILVTPDNINIAAGGDNWFIHTGSGFDALVAHGGRNVLDGGLNSNFMTGAAGQDTFFLDARGGGVTWNTIVDFGIGDDVTLWGYIPGVSADGLDKDKWYASDGVDGFKGLTIHAKLDGTSIDASITFAGLDFSDRTKMAVTEGTVEGNSYLYVTRIS